MGAVAVLFVVVWSAFQLGDADAGQSADTESGSDAVFANRISVIEPPTEEQPPAEYQALVASEHPLKRTSTSSGSSASGLKPSHKYIALTIDDGYNFQPEMLELMRSYDVRCTTFLPGKWASGNRASVKMMQDAGFEIANHSWDHPDLTKLSADEISSQLSRTQSVLKEITGKSVMLMRPPYGVTNADVKAVVQGEGYRSIMWTKTFGDSGTGITAEGAYNNVMVNNGPVRAGDIILCHWGSKATYEALKRIIPELQAQGFTFVTVSELLADSQ
ncbi:MAG: polysaccharide deacetylase family protein [Coriobacteriia bacterium]|nr:polysaccharide deacetylase family protein [Coriobacteriia bacterium]